MRRAHVGGFLDDSAEREALRHVRRVAHMPRGVLGRKLGEAALRLFAERAPGVHFNGCDDAVEHLLPNNDRDAEAE